MPLFVPALAEWLRAHHGIVSRATLLEFGLSPSSIKTMVATGELIVLYEGVYRHAACVDTFEARCAAICAADPQLVICCGGAGQLWEYRRCARVGLHVTSTAPGRAIDDDRLILHRCPLMPAGHVHQRADGIRVTSPARTIFDLAKHVGPESLESIIEQGLRRSHFDVPTLYGVGRLLCGRGRAGSRLFAQVLTSRPMWRRPVDSHPELDLLKALERRGLVLRTQVAVKLRNGHTIHPDLGDPDIGFYIEIDDHEWHGGRLASTYDKQRDRDVRLIGGTVERVGTDEIEVMSPKLLTDLIAAHALHRTSVLRTL